MHTQMKPAKLISLFAISLTMLSSCSQITTSHSDYTHLANPFIGGAADGNTYPGASVPFGSVQLSPDTRMNSCGGYAFNDSTIIGFSHTHLSGVGEPEYRDVLFMPTVGKIQLQPGDEMNTKSGYRSSFDHRQETAKPGYYSVFLKDYQVKAELTATQRCGFHQYTFPQTDSAHVIIDLAYPFGADDLYIKKISDTAVEGLRRSHGWAWDQYVYFVAEFSRPFSSFDVALNDSIQKGSSEAHGKNVKAVVSFKTKKNEIVLVRVGTSAVSAEGARKNLAAEIQEWNFDRVVHEANKSWNEALSRIEVEGGTPEQQTVFYTSMYHACLSPNVFMDVDGQYRGVDHQVHTAKGFTNYTVFSLWDTFRALHPLFTIIDQKRTTDFVKTLLQIYDDGGRLPMWPLAGNYTDDMLGYHAVPVIVDAYMKGIRNYDVEKAFKAIKHSAELDKLGLKYYKKIGFLPADRQGESVSKTLEYCYDDWCISQMAKEMGKKDDYSEFHQRAHNYTNVFDPSTGFMRGKNIDRSWLEPFDPLVNSAYSEGNAYQYLFVPHDVDGLKTLMGGDQKFSQWLDVLFSLNTGPGERGKIGQYWHGNEPGHHLAYLYDYVGEAWKTQKLVHQILTELYTNSPEGLAGNDDCGQISAWYILSSMGFYPVAPGQTIYAIGAPLFAKATINLESGKKFVIRAKNSSAENSYIQSAKLNGKVYPNSFLRHEDIMKGGVLTFEMGPKPNEKWGSDPTERPWSENGTQVVSLPYIKSGETLFGQSTTVSLDCDTKDAEIRYSLDGKEPGEESALYSTPFVIKESCTLKMRAFGKDLTPTTPISIEFKKAILSGPVNIVSEKQGLAYDYFERFFVTTDDLDISTPVSSGITDVFSIKIASKDNYYGYRFHGFIRVPKDGIYTFYLISNDGSRLFIDGQELIENDANHGSKEEPGSIGLKAGLHPILVKYFQCGGGKSLSVSWSGPGLEKHEIQAKELFCKLLSPT
ncbi:MAG: GH92 family glycosyl hydrolase [Bacteroidota bacterium]|nr:GH92 family glycosyl hydrolase [Bacteroidota bacterium]